MEVAQIKEDIRALKEEKKKKRAVGAAEPQNKGVREDTKKQAELDVAMEEEEEGPEWNMVKRSERR